MIVNSLGYIFECREDARDAVGIMESYKLIYKGGDTRVTLVTTVDSVGKIVIPSNINRSLGFRSLKDQFTTKDEVVNFSRSNKPYFSVLGEFSLVVAGTIIFDTETKEVKSTSELGFYVPKTVSHGVSEFIDKNGVQQPALICERISQDKGLNCFTVSAETYNAYLANFLRCIDVTAIDDRGTFLSSIVL